MNLTQLIKLNLDELPNEDCIHLSTENNSEGEPIAHYRLLLEKKEMGIFDTLHINVGKDFKSFSFSTFENPKQILGRIKLLVNDLHSIHGEDNSQKGQFTDDDEFSLLQNSYWSGRSFTDYKIYNPVSMLGYDKDKGLKLTIWST